MGCAVFSVCTGTTPQLVLAQAAIPDHAAQLQADILAATQMAGVRRATWGVAVESLASNDRLFDLNSRALIVPASVAKLISLATAVDAVGWDFRFTTTLRAGGVVSDGVLHGDLLIVGSGDPSIGGRGGDDLTAFVRGVTEAGIRRIEGRVVGVDDAFEEPRPGFGWSWDDLGYQTGAIFGALNLAENRMAVVVAPGARVGAPTRISLDVDAPDTSIINRSLTGPPGSRSLIWPEMRPGETSLTIGGSVPTGAAPAAIPVSVGNPTLRFARVLRRKLLEAHVEITGEGVDGDDLDVPVDAEAAPIVYTYRSPALSEIARPLLKESINVYGEAVQRLNGAGPLPRTNDQALEGMKGRVLSWGLPGDGFQLFDGSGLSRRDVIAPEVLLMVLARMFDPTGASPWMTALPIAGVDGSLAARMKGTPAENNLRAKTGTMSNIRSLAGYVRSRDGEPFAFVIMVNDFEGTGAEATAAIDAIATRLASFTR